MGRVRETKGKDKGDVGGRNRYTDRQIDTEEKKRRECPRQTFNESSRQKEIQTE